MQTASLPKSICYKVEKAINSKARDLGSVTVFACDGSGNPCGWSCRRFTAITDPLTIEALGPQEALVLAKERVLIGRQLKEMLYPSFNT